MVVGWVVPGVGYKGEFSKVNVHHVIGSLLVGSACLLLVFGSGSILEKPI